VSEEVVRDMLTDPFYAIELAPGMVQPHEPLVSEQEWVAANVKNIEEEGAAAWLRRLLRILQGDGAHWESE
jgi:hypothetical protein